MLITSLAKKQDKKQNWLKNIKNRPFKMYLNPQLQETLPDMKENKIQKLLISKMPEI